MAEYIISEITFEATEAEAKSIFAAICTDGEIDFNTLIPMPAYIYLGSGSFDEDSDFKNINWYDWSNENWGTKRNAQTVHLKWEEEQASICFQNPWSVPYPFIVAFGNRFLVDFKLNYYRADYIWSGEEEWTITREKFIRRRSKKLFDADDNLILDLIENPDQDEQGFVDRHRDVQLL